jgi:hypothetical protein
MPLLVDTYNVLHVVGVLPPDLAGLDPHTLATLISTSRYAHDSPRLICDGTPRPGIPPSVGPVRIQYAGGGIKADDLIATLVDASSAPRRLTIVSTDRQVTTHAARRKCKVLTSEEFLAHLAADAANPTARRPEGIPHQDVNEWIDQFNLTTELDLQPTAPPPRPSKPNPNPSKPREVPPKDAPEDTDALDMNKLIDEFGNWCGPDS